ncbi:MAG: ATPase domain-containing protein [Spirochaetota bacterium]
MSTQRERVSSGIRGLDEILDGGFPAGRVYLVHGDAGTGKTTLGLQFLMAGAAAGKRCLGITLLQTLAELEEIVASHGWTLDGIELTELPEEVRDAATQGQTVFAPADVELTEVTDAIRAAVEQHRPDCLFIDSLSELGVLVDTGYQLRRQLIQIKRMLDETGCTTILSAGPAGDLDTATLETLVHGVIGLEMSAPSFGRPRRRVLVSKVRGMSFQVGYHDAAIRTGGLEVYPRIRSGIARANGAVSRIESGVAEIDALLRGGLDTGTTCVISGTTGAGKSTLATLYAYSAAKRGMKSAIFCFDERPETFVRRAKGLGMPVDSYLDDGTIVLSQISVGAVSPGQFATMIRDAVETQNVGIVVIDSLSGYLQSMPGEQALVTQLHELLSYLSSLRVLTLMVVATHGLFGESESPIDVSYIADTVIVLRHFEARGEVRRCIAVMKKRFGDHERTIREVLLGGDGICVGDPLTSFSGVLTGLPRYEGEERRLMGS